LTPLICFMSVAILIMMIAPYYAFGFLLLKYMLHHSLSGLQKNDSVRRAPTTAGIVASVVGVGMINLCNTSRFLENMHVLWWVLLILFDLLLLIAWIKALILSRHKKKRPAAKTTTAPPPFI
jgi:hypothetical protein